MTMISSDVSININASKCNLHCKLRGTYLMSLPARFEKRVHHHRHRRSRKCNYLEHGIGLLLLIIGLVWICTTLYVFSHDVNFVADKQSPDASPDACVRKTNNGQCEIYLCTRQQDGVPIQTTTLDYRIGYAGRFVSRYLDVEKQTMQKGGGRVWASGCAISDKYKFAYIHILKSGGSATKEFLRKSLCGEDDEHCKKVDPSILRPIACRQIVKEHPDYFTFSFVRNPFSRMCSMYSMMDGFPRQAGGQPVTDTVPFSKFVLTEPKKRKMFTKMSPSHYFSQTDFTLSKDSCPSFDFLGRVEHFDQDMRTILERINSKEMIDYFDSIGGKVNPVNTWGSNKKKSSTNGGLQAEYSSPEIRDRVVDTYKSDFDLLGYDWQVVPST